MILLRQILKIFLCCYEAFNIAKNQKYDGSQAASDKVL